LILGMATEDYKGIEKEKEPIGPFSVKQF